MVASAPTTTAAVCEYLSMARWRGYCLRELCLLVGTITEIVYEFAS